MAFTEDVATRFIGYGWNVTRVGDANDLDMLARAFAPFKNTTDRPTLIIVDSHIGYGAPHKQDTSGAHGEPLGEEEIRLAKRNYGWPEDAKVLRAGRRLRALPQGIGKRGKELRDAWLPESTSTASEYPGAGRPTVPHAAPPAPGGLGQGSADVPRRRERRGDARRPSAKVLNAVAKNIPWLIGGAADLAPSTKTRLTFDGAGDFQAENARGRNLHFGIREHAMGAILNGMALVEVAPVRLRVSYLQRLHASPPSA